MVSSQRTNVIKPKRWTEDEIEYLHDNLGILSYQEMGKVLGRTAISIETKRFRMKDRMPTFYNNIISESTLAKELGKSRRAIKRYRLKGWIKYKIATWTSMYGHSPIIYAEKHIVAFLKRFYYLFNWSKIPNLYYRNIVKEVSTPNKAN